MAEFEIASMLESLAADTRRCAPVTTSVIRRRGDRRRVAVRALASASTVALVGATAGTAYAIGSGSGAESMVSGPSNGSRHATPVPSPVPASKSPAPVPPAPSKRHLERELSAARAHLAAHRERVSQLHARHRAGAIGDVRYHHRLRQLEAKIATDRKRIAVIKRELRHRRRKAAPAAAPTGMGTVQCLTGTSAGSSTPTPLPTTATCDTGSGRGTATPTPSVSPTSK